MSGISNINTNLYQPNLVSYLDGTTNSTGIGSQSNSSQNPPSLATYLDGDGSGSSSEDPFLAALDANSGILHTYNLPTDANGKTYIPTIEQMNDAPTPDNKLALAGYVAQAVLIQSDASTKVGNATRVSDITSQAQSVLTAVSAAVSDLNSSASGSSGSLSNAEISSISSTLNTINTVLNEVKGLLPQASADTQSTVSSTIQTLDQLGADIAGATGTAWTSVNGTSADNISGYSAPSTNAVSADYSPASLVSFLA